MLLYETVSTINFMLIYFNASINFRKIIPQKYAKYESTLTLQPNRRIVPTSSPAHLFAIRGRRKRGFFKELLRGRGWDSSSSMIVNTIVNISLVLRLHGCTKFPSGK